MIISGCGDCPDCPEKSVSQSSPNIETISNDKFVKGIIYAESVDGKDFGLVKFSGEDHEVSYCALFEAAEDDNQYLELNQNWYFKLKNVNKVPFAYEFKKSLAPSDSIYEGSKKTRLNYHAFVKHGKDDKYHKVGHFPKQKIENYTIKLARDTNDINTIETFTISEKQKNFLSEVVEGLVYFELSKDGRSLVEIDTCHYHNGEKEYCRPPKPKSLP